MLMPLLNSKLLTPKVKTDYVNCLNEAALDQSIIMAVAEAQELTRLTSSVKLCNRLFCSIEGVNILVGVTSI